MKHVYYVFVFILITSYSKAQNVNPDPRTFNNYTVAQVEEMKQSAPTKIKYLNYYYTKSYTILNGNCQNCASFDTLLFDVTSFERFRKEKERVVVNMDRMGRKIELKSKAELLITFKNMDAQ